MNAMILLQKDGTLVKGPVNDLKLHGTHPDANFRMDVFDMSCEEKTKEAILEAAFGKVEIRLIDFRVYRTYNKKFAPQSNDYIKYEISLKNWPVNWKRTG